LASSASLRRALREVELRLEGVDRDDAPALRSPHPDDVGVYAAATEHGDRRSRFDPRRVEDRTDAGGHRATDERRAVQGDFRIDPDDVLHRHGRVVGHDPAAGKNPDGIARPVVHARRALARRGERLVLVEAKHGASGYAKAAFAAHVDERRHDVVAHREIGHAFSHLDHLARSFVAKHERRRQRERAVGRGQVGVAHAAGRELHHHFAALGRVDGDSSTTTGWFNSRQITALAAWHAVLRGVVDVEPRQADPYADSECAKRGVEQVPGAWAVRT
jgi:hypothetical protein